MPYIRLDEDGFDMDDEQNVTHTGGFSYHTVEECAYKPERFDPKKLTGATQAAFAMLRAIGLVRFDVRCDGGHDEGFAHADGGQTADGTPRSIDAIITELATPTNVDVLRAAAAASTGQRHHSVNDYYAKLSPADFVRTVLDDLADTMASCMLGRGYGTGEYSMYGAFTVDLNTAAITDDPSVQRPPDVQFD